MNKLSQQVAGTALLFSSALVMSNTALAGDREQAKRIHDRIAGVPPSASVLDAMAADIEGGNPLDAAEKALEDVNFYNVTLKNFAKPWTNREMSTFVPLNDYVATVIGLVRDEADFRTVLWGDVIYTGDSNLGLPDYSNSNNAHYEALEDQNINLKDNLVRQTQSTVTGLASGATSGIVTTRAAAKSFFIAGTNRAMFRFTLLNHLCRDLEQVHDVSRSADRIRQDVSRSPGGDSRVFLNNCVGCHSGMDPLAQAYAYYNYDYDFDTDPEGEDGQLVYNNEGETDPETGTRIQEKYHINESNFAPGFVTPDDRWDNYWRAGINSLLGWDSSLPGSGNGAKSMNQELANSEAFASCQVEKVFHNVCLREPVDAADRAQISTMVTSFKNNGYNLKQVFAESAVYCMGD